MKKLLCLLIGFLAIGCEEIDDSALGVKKNWGEVVDIVGPGLHWMGIGTTIDEISMTVITLDSDVSAASYDLQQVAMKVTVQYTLNRNDALIKDMFKNIGGNVDSVSALILPAVQESAKKVTAKYKAAQLVEKRGEVKVETDDSIREFIKQTLEAKGVNGLITIVNVAITDFAFSKEFNDSIESKVRAEQEQLRALVEKTKRQTDAEARAIEIRLAAEAEAYKLEKESIAKAEAISRVAKAVGSAGPQYLKLKALERWKGDVPKVQAGQPSTNLWISEP